MRILLCLLLIGCANPTFHKVIKTKIDFHIVDQQTFCDTFPKNCSAVGMAWSNGKEYKIYVVGRIFDDKIYVEKFALGHEVKHILDWVDPDFEDTTH